MEIQQQNALNQIFSQFQQVLFPIYPLGCSSQQLISKYAPLKSYLSKIDNADLSQTIPLDAKEAVLNQLIKYLNQVCTFTHRKQLSTLIIQTVSLFKKNLANLPVGRLPISVSEWPQQISIPKLTDYIDILKNTEKTSFFDKQAKMTKLLDQIYQEQHRIPVLQHLLLKFPNVLLIKKQFQQSLFFSKQSTIPLSHKFYLGMISASTFGCKYIWNSLAKKFIKSGGDIKWIQNGIEYHGIPNFIKQLSQMSWFIAFQFQRFCTEQYYNGMIFNSQTCQKSFLQGLYIIAYYQSISCLCLVSGLIPQSNEIINNSWLHQQKTFKPSLESFEAMLHKQYKQQISEQQKAVDFVSQFMVLQGDTKYQNFDQSPVSKGQIQKITKIQVQKKHKLWQSSDEEDEQANSNTEIKLSNICEDDSNSDEQQQSKNYNKNTIQALARQDAKYEKLRNMKTIEHMKTIHNKFILKKNIDFSNNYLVSLGNNNNNYNNQDAQIPWKPTISGKLFRKNTSSNIVKGEQQNLNQTKPQSTFSNESGKTIGYSSLTNKDPSIIYASDWTFQGNALQQMQNDFSLNFANKLKKLLQSLRQQNGFTKKVQSTIIQSPRSPRSPKNIKSRSMKIYYQMINNYLCQSIDYTKLVSQGLNSAQKNFIKMVTKSPFLFNSQSFSKMRNDLKIGQQQILRLLLEVISYKLQLNMSLITAMHSKYMSLSQELQ